MTDQNTPTPADEQTAPIAPETPPAEEPAYPVSASGILEGLQSGRIEFGDDDEPAEGNPGYGPEDTDLEDAPAYDGAARLIEGLSETLGVFTDDGKRSLADGVKIVRADFTGPGQIAVLLSNSQTIRVKAEVV